MLKHKLLKRQAGILTYGLTPPKADNTVEAIKTIAAKQIERIKQLELDGLIIYDIQDEAERTELTRPFPFMQTVDSNIYANQYLQELALPKIVYRCVGKYNIKDLTAWLKPTDTKQRFAVFVGAASTNQPITISLTDAYRLAADVNPELLLGGVLIPERHHKYNDEHLRLAAKMQQGCKYFITQAVYNVEAAKNVLSEYYYYCQQHELEMVPILINLTPCGSEKTLTFMKWLGINFPKWLENELMNSHDILDQSIKLSANILEELLEFSLPKQIPLGCSVESVSTRKVEIDASVQLIKTVQQLFARV